MVQLRLHPRREQRVLLAACTTTSARTAAPVRPEPGIADEVLFDLRQADAYDADLAAARAKLLLPMHNPAGRRFLPSLLAEAGHVLASRDTACRVLFDEDRKRREDIAAAAWIDEAIGAELAEHRAAVLDAVAGRPELLAPPAHPGPRLWLRQIAVLLDEPLPGTDWAAALAAVLPVRVATMNGPVA